MGLSFSFDFTGNIRIRFLGAFGIYLNGQSRVKIINPIAYFLFAYYMFEGLISF